LLSGDDRAVEFERLQAASARAAELGLEVHAGHGLNYETAADMLAIAEVRELNIGHFLIGEALFIGLAPAIRRMRAAMDAA
ncbi:MAG: pyridoxine 5'-phosphate synthase, partial [Brevundimonas sp.]